MRVGSETKVASESQFDSLIAERQSKPYEILRWKGKEVTVDYLNTERTLGVLGAVQSRQSLTLVDCNSFYVTLQRMTSQVCIPLTRINVW